MYLNPQLADVIGLTSEPFSLALALAENGSAASLPFPKASVERCPVEIMASSTAEVNIRIARDKKVPVKTSIESKVPKCSLTCTMVRGSDFQRWASFRGPQRNMLRGSDVLFPYTALSPSHYVCIYFFSVIIVAVAGSEHFISNCMLTNGQFFPEHASQSTFHRRRFQYFLYSSQNFKKCCTIRFHIF